MLEREQLVDELVRFPYASVDRDPYNDVSPDRPGARSQVQRAVIRGLINEEIYEHVFSLRHPTSGGA